MKELNNLLPQTQKVLEKLASLPFLENFTFVGGSALAVYLGHRRSEDIDLFTWKAELNLYDLQKSLHAFENVQTANLSPTQADFFINGVKTTFFANCWEKLQQRTSLLQNLYIADLEILAIMKVNTLFLRATFRDYYDLYVLLKEKFTIQELYKISASEISNLSKVLFQRALIYTQDIADESIAHLSPKYQVSLQEIAAYFEKQIRLWNNPRISRR